VAAKWDSQFARLACEIRGTRRGALSMNIITATPVSGFLEGGGDGRIGIRLLL
jgi:hypothetical protein